MATRKKLPGPKRNKPKLVNDKVIQLRLAKAHMDTLDQLRRKYRTTSRAHAMRLLLEDVAPSVQRQVLEMQKKREQAAVAAVTA